MSSASFSRPLATFAARTDSGVAQPTTVPPGSAPFEEVSLFNAGDNRFEQGIEAVDCRKRGVALAQLATLEVERAETHEHAVHHGVDPEVPMLIIAGQFERVERRVVEPGGGEPGAHEGHIV